MAGRITGLRAQAKNKRRVNVCLDGAFALGLPSIVAATLRVGQFLSDEDITSLRERDGAERAYEQALRFLSYRPRSSEEVRRYLARKEIPADLSAGVVERLQIAGLLDDQAFARYWVENRESYRPRGGVALRQELRRKGIDEEAIGEAIEGVDEGDGAYRIARTRALRLQHADRDTFRRRLRDLLVRRGYSYETVKETVERLWRERALLDSAGQEQASG